MSVILRIFIFITNIDAFEYMVRRWREWLMSFKHRGFIRENSLIRQHFVAYFDSFQIRGDAVDVICISVSNTFQCLKILLVKFKMSWNYKHSHMVCNLFERL